MHNFSFLGHNVDEHHHAKPVGLQLIWSAEPAAGLQETTEKSGFEVFDARFLVFCAQCRPA